MPRKPISDRAKQEVLLSSKRRCALCFVSGNEEPRKGAVAEMDHGASSSSAQNLVFLCLEHHRQVDQGALTAAEVRQARARLCKALNAESPRIADERPWTAYEEHVVALIRSSMGERLGDYFGLRRGDLLVGRSGVAYEVDPPCGVQACAV